MKALKLTLLYVFFVFFMHGMEKDKKELGNSKILRIKNYCGILHSKNTLNLFRIMKSMNATIEHQNFLQKQFKKFTIFTSEEIKNDEEKTRKLCFNDLETVISELCLNEETIIICSDSNENMNNKENPEQRPKHQKSSNNITFKVKNNRRNSFP